MIQQEECIAIIRSMKTSDLNPKVRADDEVDLSLSDLLSCLLSCLLSLKSSIC